MTLSSAYYRHDDVFLQEHSSAGVGGGQESFLAGNSSTRNLPLLAKDARRMGHTLSYFFFLLLPAFFLPKTRAKILSTFFSWRLRLKACSICLRGTLAAISWS